MNQFVRELRKSIEGEVRTDEMTRRAYSVDASIYEIEPLAIVLPKNSDEVVRCLSLAAQYNISVIPRGAATGITGGCIGHGLVIDTTKHLNRILEINIEKEYVICEPGVVQEQLNKALAPHGYRLGPDTSTGNRATIGGMVANNSAGARSLLYGKMVDHILEADLLLSGGEKIFCRKIPAKEWKKLAEEKTREGSLYREIARIKEEYSYEIENHFPNIPRRASGYNLDELLKSSSINLCKLVAGSEGSFGFVTSVKLSISKKSKYSGIAVIHLKDLVEGLAKIPQLLTAKPVALEMIDHEIIKMGRLSPLMRGRLDWLKGDTAGLFVAEFFGESEEQLKESLQNFEKIVHNSKTGEGFQIFLDHQRMENVWKLRESGLGLLMSRRSYARGIAFVEDVSVAPEKLASFIQEFQRLLQRNGKAAGIYGHVGSGCIHVRPYIDLKKPEDVASMTKIMDEVAALVAEHHGALSGEHGDGLLRAWTHERMFGKRIAKAFVELKRAFDPTNLMNPGKVVPNQGFLENLRNTPEVPIQKLPTAFDWSREGGIELSIEMCNGNGQCRKKTGLMCPSFHVTGEERDTTRARAQALRAIINRRLPIDEYTGREMREILDLCIECKGCKTECPSQVDMTKMKSEVLHQYHKEWSPSLRTKLFGGIATINKWGCLFSPFSNWLAESRLSRKMLDRIGIASQRPLPAFSRHRFSQWWKSSGLKGIGGKPVVLFIDTFTEFNYPGIGQAAVRILTELGYRVEIPKWTCCGRSYISKGLLDKAKKQADAIVERFKPYIAQGIPIIGLEPSCVSVLKDELRDLSSDPAAKSIAAVSKTLDEFLYEIAQFEKLTLPFKKRELPVRLHTHCHQKALIGSKPTLELLKLIPGFQVEEIDSGCCGMAGSFGYEKEHYDFSLKIAETRLFPAARSAPKGTLFVANGTSCRCQLEHGLSLHPLHIAEVISGSF